MSADNNVDLPSSVGLRSRLGLGGAYSEDWSTPDPPEANDEWPLSRNSPVSAHTVQYNKILRNKKFKFLV